MDFTSSRTVAVLLRFQVFCSILGYRSASQYFRVVLCADNVFANINWCIVICVVDSIIVDIVPKIVKKKCGAKKNYVWKMERTMAPSDKKLPNNE